VRGAGAAIAGRLMNVEAVNSAGKDGQMVEKRLITVVGDGGEVKTMELTPSTAVKLLDADLHTDVTRYLALLASTRNEGLRHLTLEDNGTGARELRVSYISEVPVWKSTYRILFTDPVKGAEAKKQTATLQGWSVVDNTTGADWNNVQLSLIAGAPQSFIQPLSVPYYSRRPQIGLPQEAQLVPQTHESGDMGQAKMPAAVSGVAGQAYLDGFTGGRGVMGGMGSGVGAGSGGNYGGGVRAEGNASATVIDGAAMDSLSDDSYQLSTQLSALGGRSTQQLAAASFGGKTTGSTFDDYFEYKITEPVTIRKNESAMVPILQTKVDAERVTLWSSQQRIPLRALWVTNTSDLTLDRGSFSIVEDGNFGGEGLLDPIHPNEKRLLSYAVDQAVRVSTEGQKNSSRVTSVTAAKGVVMLHQAQVSEVTYVVRNAAADARTVIVEHPVRQGYALDSDPKPEETTPAMYRFRVATEPGATVRLHVVERHAGVTSYRLTNSNDSQLTVIMDQTNGNAAVKQALMPILDARRKVAEMQTEVDKVNARLASLRADEERQRSNVTALGNADKLARERFVRDLNATEDQIAAAQKDLATAQGNLQGAKDDLAGKIEGLQINETL